MAYTLTLGELRERLNRISDEKKDLKVYFCNTSSGVYDLVDGGGIVETPTGKEDGDELPIEFVVLYSS